MAWGCCRTVGTALFNLPLYSFGPLGKQAHTRLHEDLVDHLRHLATEKLCRKLSLLGQTIGALLPSWSAQLGELDRDLVGGGARARDLAALADEVVRSAGARVGSATRKASRSTSSISNRSRTSP